jgi:hypothetical protein
MSLSAARVRPGRSSFASMLRVRTFSSCRRHSTISSRQCSGRPVEPGIFELQEMLDDVLDERLRRAEIAASQILDLLGDVLKVERVAARLVHGRRQTAQQRRLLLRPGVEIRVVKGICAHVGCHLTARPACGKARQRADTGSIRPQPADAKATSTATALSARRRTGQGQRTKDGARAWQPAPNLRLLPRRWLGVGLDRMADRAKLIDRVDRDR